MYVIRNAHWEKREKSWGNNDASGRKYTTDYSGGYDITKCPGFPDINGGFGTPDFNYTPAGIRRELMERYKNWRGKERKIIIKLTITRDDRNPTMDNFFK